MKLNKKIYVNQVPNPIYVSRNMLKCSGDYTSQLPNGTHVYIENNGVLYAHVKSTFYETNTDSTYIYLIINDIDNVIAYLNNTYSITKFIYGDEADELGHPNWLQFSGGAQAINEVPNGYINTFNAEVDGTNLTSIENATINGDVTISSEFTTDDYDFSAKLYKDTNITTDITFQVSLPSNTSKYIQFIASTDALGFLRCRIYYISGGVNYYLQDDLTTWNTTANDINALDNTANKFETTTSTTFTTDPSYTGTYYILFRNSVDLGTAWLAGVFMQNGSSTIPTFTANNQAFVATQGKLAYINNSSVNSTGGTAGTGTATMGILLPFKVSELGYLGTYNVYGTTTFNNSTDEYIGMIKTYNDKDHMELWYFSTISNLAPAVTALLSDSSIRQINYNLVYGI